MYKYILIAMLCIAGCESTPSNHVNSTPVAVIDDFAWVRTVKINGHTYYCTHVHSGIAIGPEVPADALEKINE